MSLLLITAAMVWVIGYTVFARWFYRKLRDEEQRSSDWKDIDTIFPKLAFSFPFWPIVFAVSYKNETPYEKEKDAEDKQRKLEALEKELLYGTPKYVSLDLNENYYEARYRND